jgi:hypothetical protein
LRLDPKPLNKIQVVPTLQKPHFSCFAVLFAYFASRPTLVNFRFVIESHTNDLLDFAASKKEQTQILKAKCDLAQFMQTVRLNDKDENSGCLPRPLPVYCIVCFLLLFFTKSWLVAFISVAHKTLRLTGRWTANQRADTLEQFAVQNHSLRLTTLFVFLRSSFWHSKSTETHHTTISFASFYFDVHYHSTASVQITRNPLITVSFVLHLTVTPDTKQAKLIFILILIG